MKEIKYIILYLVLVPEPIINYGSGSCFDFFNKLRFRSTSQKVRYDTYGSGSGSTTLALWTCSVLSTIR
jgi:hypothetical protein